MNRLNILLKDSNEWSWVWSDAWGGTLDEILHN